MAGAKSERTVMVEYPIDVVYETLVYLFPIKTLRLRREDKSTYTVEMNDAVNYTLVMNAQLKQYTPNTTIIYFVADYPHAVADLTGSGKKNINKVLRELLIELEKQPKPENVENEYTPRDDIEVINSQIFTQTTQPESNTKMIIAGYIFSALMFILPLIELSLSDHRSSLAAMLVIGGIFCFIFAMIIATLLSFDSDARKSIMHGKIQACLCGLFFIILGLSLHPIFILLGVLVPGIIIGYSMMRDRKSY